MVRCQIATFFVSGCLIAYCGYPVFSLLPYAGVLLLALAFDYVSRRADFSRAATKSRKSHTLTESRRPWVSPSVERFTFIAAAWLLVSSLGVCFCENNNIDRRVSIVIPSRFEQDYIVKTVKYVFDTTPMTILHEIVLVDDESPVPIAPLIQEALRPGGELYYLTMKQRKAIIILRNDGQHEGLIRGKIQGANVATGNYIFFLDGHCRPNEFYMEEMLNVIEQGDYKRIVVPKVGTTDPKTWKNSKDGGAKMIFEWNFNFHWFDDGEDEVPIMSGGLLLMTKQWWNEGGLDEGMLDWGGENIEQSIRTWLCGGEIVIARKSIVGHIFDRPANPNKVGPGIVKKNQARAAFTWLDDYVTPFIDASSVPMKMDNIGDLTSVMMKRKADYCRPFNHFMKLFSKTFEQKGLFVHNMHHLRDVNSALCMHGDGKQANAKGNDTGTVSFRPCRQTDARQMWSMVSDGRRLINKWTGTCLDAANGSVDGMMKPVLYPCDFGKKAVNMNQSWKFVGLQSPPRRSNTNSIDHQNGDSSRGFLTRSNLKSAGRNDLQPMKPWMKNTHDEEAACIGKRGYMVDCSHKLILEWIW
eukprot:GEMP01011244.1.p1 GENE.GEMP01011244.1~~GEMP01011244.1.p1  ORF type:complete len:583 (+),score=103.47 GEMP01011244.1:124-1872(+)